MDKAKSKKLKSLIVRHVKNHGRITTAQGKELIRDAFECDLDEAYEHFMGNFVRSAISSLRDDDGVRTTFSTHDTSGHRLFVNVDSCRDKKLVQTVIAQLEDRRDGINKSLDKCDTRVRQIEGQVAWDFGREKIS
jgi:hypothetical protein